MSNWGKEMAVKEQIPNYISNMKLPEKVKATRLQPLGPDCIISNTEVTDPAILRTVQYYWCISRETGCVECIVKPSKSDKTVTASDPRCVVTKKHRRFEAYCCMICRFNFVTIVQALSHLKAIHRPNNKILIQDKDVFQNLDKAMEVPPVPLPWHVAKKLVEQGKPPDETNPPPTYVIPPGSLTSSTITNTVATRSTLDNTVPKRGSFLSGETATASSKEDFSNDSPMVCIIAALTDKFEKKVAQLKFEEDCSKLNAIFVDGTSVIANIPDLSYAKRSTDIPSSDDSDEQLKFFVDEALSQNGNKNGVETVTLVSNRPQYAKKMFTKTILAAAPEADVPFDSNLNQEVERKSDMPEITEVKSLTVEESDSDAPKPHKSIKKSVRFSVGHPDSDDERDASPEIQETDLRVQDVVPAIRVSNPHGEPVKNKEDNGLQTVISDLMSTASKGRIIAPTSPIPSTSPINTPIPQVGSSPALLNMALQTSTSGSLTRVQSWSPSVAPSPFSVASMRRPYTARGFTYAEKIQYMKQQNDYDAEFVSKHIREKDSSKSKASTETKASSDGEERMTLRKRRSNRRYSEEEPHDAEDSDSQDTSMADSAALAAAYTSLIQRGLFNPGLFPSEYYGSGEWASTAIETLKSLQPLLKSQEEPLPARLSSDLPPFCKSETASPNSNRSAFLDSKDSLSDDNVSMVKRSSRTKPYEARKRYKSRNNSSSSADDPGSPPKRKKRSYNKTASLTTVHSDSRLPSGVTLHSESMGSETSVESEPWMRHSLRAKGVGEKLSSQTKVPLSPLLNESEKNHIQQHHHTRQLKTEPSSTLTVSKIRSLNEPPVKHLTISNLSKNMGSKCSSDPNLSLSSSSNQRSSQSHHQSSSRMSTGKSVKSSGASSNERSTGNLLFANDQLELLDNVSMSDYEAKKVVNARLKSNELNAEKQMTVLLLLEGNKKSSLLKEMTAHENQFISRVFEANNLSEIPEIFRNCIESRVKLRIVQKVFSCKVCGFSVDISQGEVNQGGASPLDILEAHVMEHSLKELYATKL